jgi:hypothetical protein
MFRKSNKTKQLDAFTSVTSMLDDLASKQFNDKGHWHNQFRNQIVMRIDESIFSVLFDSTTGAPNAPVRVLIGMMILKESFGWSDSQLYEHCRFDLLTRSALGMFNINDPLPVESTYYLLRKRIYEYQKGNGEDLVEKSFAQITHEQVRAFDVNGKSIRMDSKLIGSNIAFSSRYENIHKTLNIFYKSLDKSSKLKITLTDTEQIEILAGEEPSKIVYRHTKEEITSRLQLMGVLIYKLLHCFDGMQTESYQLLKRLFSEQYKVADDQQIELRPKEEISSSSIQSPHDPDSAYRNKQNKPVRGYCVNITETCSDDSLSLITNVMVDKANVSEQDFVEQAIRSTIDITGQPIEKYYADGAYQSPVFDQSCSTIDMVYTGFQGVEPRYDLELTQQGLLVIDTLTGDRIMATAVKNRTLKAKEKWKIKTSKGYYYFTQKAIRNAIERRKLKERPVEELNKRNNVEATIFQLCHRLRNNKSKYRGQIKHQIWAICRCLWINLIRIANYLKKEGNNPKKSNFGSFFENLMTKSLLLTMNVCSELQSYR